MTPPFITHDSWAFKKILIQSMKLVTKPNFSNVVSKNLWPKESKVFLLSIVNTYSLVLNFSVTSSKSEINLPHWVIHLLATSAICCYKFNNGSTFLSLAEKKIWNKITVNV